MGLCESSSCCNASTEGRHSGKSGAIDLIEFVLHTQEQLGTDKENGENHHLTPERKKRLWGGQEKSSEREEAVLGPSGSDAISRTISMRKKAF